jgi:hypothetical protein
MTKYVTLESALAAIAHADEEGGKDAARALLVQPVVSEPVAVVAKDYAIFWAGSGPISPIVKKHDLRPGSKLYATPQVSTKIAQMTDAQKEHLIGRFFSEEWSREAARGLIHDLGQALGIT